MDWMLRRRTLSSTSAPSTARDVFKILPSKTGDFDAIQPDSELSVAPSISIRPPASDRVDSIGNSDGITR
jgi:hypothetical protein